MREKDSFQVLLYKLYVFTLPLGRFLNIWFDELMERLFLQFSTMVMLLGVIIIVFHGDFYINKRIMPFFKLFLFMAVWSILCSVVLAFFVPGSLKSPLVTCLPDIYYSFLAVLSFFYNYYCLTHLVRFEKLYKLFDIQILLLLLVGFAQYAAFIGVAAPYNLLCQVFALKDLEWLFLVDRGVTLWGNEPSSVSIVSFCVLPYIYTSIVKAKGWSKFKYIVCAILFFALFAGSNSSQTLLLYLACTGLFIIFLLLRKFPKVLYKVSFVAGFLAVSIYLFDFKEVEVQGGADSIEYALFAKVLDKENESTAVRVSTIVNDLKIIGSYPITGVGNGNQGFFYAENLPKWVSDSESVQDFLMGRVVVNGGGNVFPSFFSGFGLIGALFLLLFIKRYRYNYSTSFLQKDNRLNSMYQMGVILFLFAGWTVVDLRESIIFLLSLAFVEPYTKQLLKK